MPQAYRRSVPSLRLRNPILTENRQDQNPAGYFHLIDTGEGIIANLIVGGLMIIVDILHRKLTFGEGQIQPAFGGTICFPCN